MAEFYVFKLPPEFSDSSIQLMVKMLDVDQRLRGDYDKILNTPFFQMDDQTINID